MDYRIVRFGFVPDKPEHKKWSVSVNINSICARLTVLQAQPGGALELVFVFSVDSSFRTRHLARLKIRKCTRILLEVVPVLRQGRGSLPRQCHSI
jgi:hypothetical protein